MQERAALRTSTALDVQARRIYSEYLEMPGLRLTSAQGQRLWGLESTTCVAALQLLVDAGFLRRTDAGQYVRISDGSTGGFPVALVYDVGVVRRRPAPR